MNYFSIFLPMKNEVRFEYVSWKMSDFVSFLLVGFSLVLKFRNFNFETHWNILIFFDKKDIMSDLNMYDGKIADFVSFSLFGLILVIKLKNFDFQSYWNTLVFFNQEKKLHQIWVRPFKQCLIWFKLCCLSWILAINWEIRILNFTEIV